MSLTDFASSDVRHPHARRLRARLRLAGSLLLAAVGATVLILLALWLMHRSSGSAVAPAVAMRGADLRLVSGEGDLSPDSLEIRQPGASGVAVVQGVMPALDAGGYRSFAWRVDGLKPDQELQLAWSSAENPRHPHYRTLPYTPSGEGLLDLRGEPNWRGQIVAIALLIKGAMHEPLRVQGLELRPEPPTLASQFAAILSEWTRVDGWTGRSINFNQGAARDGRVPPVPVMALWIGLGSLLFALMNPPWRGFRSLLPYGLLVVAGWLPLDLMWQQDLIARLRQTASLYAGLDETQRQLAGPDRALYAFLREVRGHLPDAPARVFILGADPAGSTLGRARYHLLPHNVSLGAVDPPSVDQARPGDYLLVLSPMGQVRFDRERALLIAGSAQLPVEPAYMDNAAGELFRVRGGQ